MLKLIETGLEYFGEPSVRVVLDPKSPGLIKSAADSAISQYVSTLEPEPGKIYIHVLAMGAGEFYGANRNSDFFPEENLKKYHKTFEDTGYIYAHHRNKDPSTAMGKVLFSVYNDRMHRVELIAWVDRVKGAEFVDRIEAGEYPATSMACRTKYDVCSICGNRAHTRQDYCEHLAKDLGRIYPDGRRVMAMNVAPLQFIDNSFVIRPADPTAAVLQKIASQGSVAESSAELAELAGLTEKSAEIRKLSELIKEVDGGVIVDHADSINEILAKVKDPGHDVIPHLNQHELGDILNAMAHLGISPSLRFLADMIGHRLAGEDGVGIGHLIETYIAANGLDGIPLHEGEHGGSVNPALVGILQPHVKSASLLPEYVTHRAVVHSGVSYVPGTNVGYVGNGPHVEETAVERWNRLAGHPEASKPGGLLDMIKTLVMVGGAALAAKWYITREIERRSREIANVQQPQVKIVLVKSANDYRVTYRLAKQAMVSAIRKI